MDHALTRQKIKELRALVVESDRIAVVLQDDPDPDAMSSAIALRTLLGRNKQTTPIFAFTPVTRPENRTMTHLLVIDHHPNYAAGLAPFEDIRVGYGATATIMTEYLRTAEEHISERLATALL